MTAAVASTTAAAPSRIFAIACVLAGGAQLRFRDRLPTYKAMIITLIIFGLIVVVAFFARPKITSWRTYAAADLGALLELRHSRGQRADGQ